jgi:hypothetical protein
MMGWKWKVLLFRVCMLSFKDPSSPPPSPPPAGQPLPRGAAVVRAGGGGLGGHPRGHTHGDSQGQVHRRPAHGQPTVQGMYFCFEYL